MECPLNLPTKPDPLGRSEIFIKAAELLSRFDLFTPYPFALVFTINGFGNGIHFANCVN